MFSSYLKHFPCFYAKKFCFPKYSYPQVDFPALGYRAIRLCLTRKDFFKTQPPGDAGRPIASSS